MELHPSRTSRVLLPALLAVEDSPEQAVVEQRGFTVGAEGAEYPL